MINIVSNLNGRYIITENAQFSREEAKEFLRGNPNTYLVVTTSGNICVFAAINISGKYYGTEDINGLHIELSIDSFNKR